MTTSPPTPDDSDGDGDGDGDDYDAMLEQLDGAIDEIGEKIENGRIRDAEKEKVRIQYYRALGYLIRTKRKVLEDKTLEELAAEVEELREEDDVTLTA